MAEQENSKDLISVFWEYAKFQHPTHQMSFHSIRALECLEYEGSESVNDDTME